MPTLAAPRLFANAAAAAAMLFCKNHTLLPIACCLFRIYFPDDLLQHLYMTAGSMMRSHHTARS